MRYIFAIIFIAFPLMAFSDDELPKDWRFATQEELSEGLIKWREDSPSKYTRAEADLNGDGIKDYAFLVKSRRHNGQGLLVKLSNGVEYTWHVVDEIKWPDEYEDVGLSMGVDVYEPGTYEIYCDSYDDNSNKKCSVNIKNPALGYFKFASASSIIYWNEVNKSFIRVWNGD